MPLGISELGKEVKVVRTVVDVKIKRHLENLGILTGELITPIAENKGDLIVKVRDSRLALNRGLAMKIFVQ